jgi:hypothetical protein
MNGHPKESSSFISSFGSVYYGWQNFACNRFFYFFRCGRKCTMICFYIQHICDSILRRLFYIEKVFVFKA